MSEEPIEMVVGFRVPGTGEVHSKTVSVDLKPDEPRPWDLNTELAVVGQRHRRQDGVAKVTGAARYSYDINLPGMLFAGFYRSPHARAAVTRIDFTKAAAFPGVQAGLELKLTRVRYAGEPLLALAAESRQALDAALRLVEVEYEVQRHAATMELAMAEDAPPVHGNRPNVSEGRGRSDDESITKAFETADAVVEATVTTQVQTHSSLETHGCVAHWEGRNLTLYASTQATFAFRDQIASILDSAKIPYDSIKVISPFVGGGFGSKFSPGYHGRAAVLLAHQANRPVKLLLNRKEEHLDTGNRPSTIQKMRLAVSKNGQLGAYRLETWGTPGIGRGAGCTNPMIYGFGPVAKVHHDVATNAGPSAAFRAPGHPEGSVGVECIVDLAAEAIGMDPVEFRKRNDPHPVRQVQYDDGARRIGWSQRQATGSQTGRIRRGFGVGSALWYQLGGPRAEVRVRIFRDGRVEARSGAQDIGTGTRTLLAIIVAEDLGLPVDRVLGFVGDTTDPIGPGSGGSTTAPSLSPAARQAGFLAGRELRSLVAAHLECQADDLLLAQGRITHQKDASKSLSFEEACRLIRGEIDVVGKRGRNWDQALYESNAGGVQFAEVLVDTHFGNVQVV